MSWCRFSSHFCVYLSTKGALRPNVRGQLSRASISPCYRQRMRDVMPRDSPHVFCISRPINVHLDINIFTSTQSRRHFQDFKYSHDVSFCNGNAYTNTILLDNQTEQKIYAHVLRPDDTDGRQKRRKPCLSRITVFSSGCTASRFSPRHETPTSSPRPFVTNLKRFGNNSSRKTGVKQNILFLMFLLEARYLTFTLFVEVKY